MTLIDADVDLDVVHAVRRHRRRDPRRRPARPSTTPPSTPSAAVWLDRKVVFFPGQHLDPDEHLRLRPAVRRADRGPPGHPRHRRHPEVFEIDYTAARELYASYGDVSTQYRGIHWHTDVTFVERPPLGSILRAVVVPPAGGDTHVLQPAGGVRGPEPGAAGVPVGPDRRARRAGPVQGRCSTGSARAAGRATMFRSLEPVEHPVVRTHPETGARVAVREPRLHVTHQGAGARRERRPPRVPLRPLGQARVHGALPLAPGRRSASGTTARPSTRWPATSATQHRVIQRVTLRGDEPR